MAACGLVGGPPPLPWDPRLCVQSPAKNPYVSVKCLHFQMLATHSKTKHCGAKGNRWKVPSGPAGRRVSPSSYWVFAGCPQSAHTISFTSNRSDEAALMVPVSQPRELRPREGKPPTKATQQVSRGVGAGTPVSVPKTCPCGVLCCLHHPDRKTHTGNLHSKHEERKGQSGNGT